MNDAESLMEWFRYRAMSSGRSYVLRAYQKLFIQMWEGKFGTTDNIPKEFKKEIESIWTQYKAKEDGNEGI